MSDSNRVRLSIVEETVFGTEPGTPTFQELRYVSEDLGQELQSQPSAEILSNRQQRDEIILSQSGNGNINCELSATTFDLLFQAVLMAAALGNNGTTLRFFTIAKDFMDVSESIRYDGVVFNSMDLRVERAGIPQLTFGTLLQAERDGTAVVTSPTAATATEIIRAGESTVVVNEGGSPLTDATSFRFNMNNNLRNRYVLGDLLTLQHGVGSLMVRGTIQRYFSDQSQLSDFRAGTVSDLELILEDSAGDGYKFDFHKIKYVGKPRVVAGGKDQDVLAELDWVALYDTVAGATIGITAET